QDGGGIYTGSGGTVQLNNSIVRYNLADRNCGGICDHGTGVGISDSTILSNTAQTVGGVGGYTYVVTVMNSTVMSNTATDGDGGGLYNNSVLTLINVSVIGNVANNGQNFGGGGLYNNAGIANVTDSMFSGNQALGR